MDSHFFYEITITRGHTLEGVLPVAPHIDEYIFMYWSTAPQGGPVNINTPLYYDTSLYAVWRSQDDPAGGFEEFAHGDYLNDQAWGNTSKNITTALLSQTILHTT